MNVRILNAAENDLIDGYWFYENQEAGLGSILWILCFLILIH
jgi:hypothetical protein